MSEMVTHPGHQHPLSTDKSIPRYEECTECRCYVRDGESTYYCNICDKWWHIKCMRASSEMVKLPGHHHLLLPNKYYPYFTECCECSHQMSKGQSNYFCNICNEWWHRKCMPVSSELLNHPFHPNHALKLLAGEAPDYADGKCHFCQEEISDSVYHCSTCNFSLDVRCANSPERVKIDESKCHNHPLTLMARQVSFVCNACGTLGDRNPYVCVVCSFMVHQDCVNLPHVIHINRHAHRISHTYSLGPGKRICRVCRLNVDWIYGAYSCQQCPEFVVHSECATRWDVWDGEEVEGVPEEEEEEPMFKVVGESVINHVKHSAHNLRLTDDGVLRDHGVRCQLCEGLVYSDKFYSCLECDYILHQACAYLPKRKRLCFSSSPYLLKDVIKDALKEANQEEPADAFFKCGACKQPSTGHMYVAKNGVDTIDLRCAAVDWSCDHACHPHTLFLTVLSKDTCGACYVDHYVLRCVDCKFNLCYKCASYPKMIKHRCDDHPLVLSFGDKEQHGTTWCTVCETDIDLKKWFYECEGCGIVCHIQCVLGDFTNLNPGLRTIEQNSMEGMVPGVASNNSSTRPHCSICATRCLAPFIFRYTNTYICSLACFETFKRNIERQKTATYVQRAALHFIQSHYKKLSK